MALFEKPESQGLFGVDLKKKIIQQQRVGGVMGLRSWVMGFPQLYP